MLQTEDIVFQQKFFLRKKWKQAGSLDNVSENSYTDLCMVLRP